MPKTSMSARFLQCHMALEAGLPLPVEDAGWFKTMVTDQIKHIIDTMAGAAAEVWQHAMDACGGDVISAYQSVMVSTGGKALEDVVDREPTAAEKALAAKEVTRAKHVRSRLPENRIDKAILGIKSAKELVLAKARKGEAEAIATYKYCEKQEDEQRKNRLDTMRLRRKAQKALAAQELDPEGVRRLQAAIKAQLDEMPEPEPDRPRYGEAGSNLIPRPHQKVVLAPAPRNNGNRELTVRTRPPEPKQGS